MVTGSSVSIRSKTSAAGMDSISEPKLVVIASAAIVDKRFINFIISDGFGDLLKAFKPRFPIMRIRGGKRAHWI
jgi:hypothetical protein